MTIHSASPRSIGLRLPVLKALGVAVGITALTATGALAAQHETKPQQGQSQQMPGPSFERMQEMMQQAGEAKDPAERRQLMRQHMQMMGEKMQAMRGMMGDMPMHGRMGGGQMSSGSSMGMSGDKSGQMPQMMGAATPEMMTRMREHQGMMQQMMEQMLEQQRMMMDKGEQ
ncbi:hypothetical protein ABIE65_005079 [Constrictibacter sp. MBR-5]|mgnify:FL=1|jgi:hypothetical protein|uniref:hypothetical protein n=1 Tax=Constrictibacter sp. MBR-5 TaxID=3156467 RepID=UPI0033948338